MADYSEKAEKVLAAVTSGFQKGVDFVTNVDYAALANTASTRGAEYAELYGGKAKEYGLQAATKGSEFSIVAGTYTLKFLNATVPWLAFIVSMMKILVPLAALAWAGYQIYLRANDYWIEGDPDQYGLLIRNGNLIKQGVGLTTWTLPGDQFVQFPAQIRQCPFSAEQVTLEMQGVRVSGMIIWSPYRDGDGPYKLYKAFGPALFSANSSQITNKICSMAQSFIRDKIANMTINDILKNRAMLRDGIKNDMQKLLTGWGMWMETIEISDVSICSHTLFSQMQAEFREENRVKAHRLECQSNLVIEQRELAQNHDYKLRQQKQYDSKLRRDIEISAEQKAYRLKNDAKKQVEKMKVNKAINETQVKKLQQELSLEAAKKDAQLETRKRELELEDDKLTVNEMRNKVMGTMSTIMYYVKAGQSKHVNIDENGMGGGADGKTQNMLGHMIMQYQAISNATK